jgi:hypothetical protein
MVMNRLRRIKTWAHAGYAARGLVYILLGWIALSSGRALGAGEAVQEMGDLPLGGLILPLLALGLFGYGLYKIYAGLSDVEGKGSDVKGKAMRAAYMVGGLGYWGLSFVALKATLGGSRSNSGQAEGSEGAQQEIAREVAQSAGGDMLLVLIGTIVLVVAGYQFVTAFKAKFMDDMEAGAPAFVKPAGQAGYAARGVVFALVGWFAVQAGLGGERVRSSGDALALLRDGYGWLFTAVAAGLVLFGITSLVMARYRHIRDADIADAARQFVPGR